MKNKVGKLIIMGICTLWMILGISINTSNAMIMVDAVYTTLDMLWTRYIAIILIMLIVILIFALIINAIKKKNVKKILIYTIVCLFILFLIPIRRIHESRRIGWS